MRFKRRRGLRMFAVAALVPMMAMAQAVKPAAPQDPVVQQVIERVRDFLSNVPKNDPAVFQDFFADDVIYTRATGVTVNKAEILKNIDVRANSQPQATYDADQFTVHPYGDMAVVNFRLILHNVEDGKPVTVYYRNTGTFMKRKGKWQAVAWQATKAAEEANSK
jgi:ketosteroid isomerase-like protein